MQTFDESARYYDAVYAARGKDYRAEADAILTIARRERADDPRSMLDVACGTGAHLVHCSDRVPHREGVDASAAMLRVARPRLHDVTLHRASMTTFDLPPRFDLVTCLFASIAYLDDLASMHAAIRRMAGHLHDDGVLVLEPGVRRERVQPPRTSEMSVTVDGTRVDRVTSGRVSSDGSVLHVRFRYSIERPGDDAARVFDEDHPIRLFEDDAYRRAMSDAGLVAREIESPLFPHGLFVARRAGKEKT